MLPALPSSLIPPTSRFAQRDPEGFGRYDRVRPGARDLVRKKAIGHGGQNVTQLAEKRFCPFSLQRLIRVTAEGKVLYRAEKPDCQRFPEPADPDLFGGVSRNFQVFDPLDFIAELTQHIPQPRKHLVRYFGFYSSAARGRRAKAHATHDAAAEPDHDPISSHQARRRWAALIKHIWKVDPLVCTRCGERMKIVSFISPTQQQVIEKILTHCGLADQPSRAPPAEPDPARLRYVSEPPFVDESAPAELVWTAD